MTHDLRAKLERATRLAEGATTPGERDAAEAAIKRLKKAMKRAGQDKPFEAPLVQPTAASNCRHVWERVDADNAKCRNCGLVGRYGETRLYGDTIFAYTGTQEGFRHAWDEFLHGKRREAPKRPGPVKFPNAGSAAYPKAYPRR